MQHAVYQSLRQLRGMAEQRPEAFTEVERVWHCYANGEEMCDGPVAVTHSILFWMGWHWHIASLCVREGRPPWACWMDREAGGFMNTGKTSGLQNGEEQETDVAT